LASAAPASAFESYSRDVVLDHTFTDLAGDQVTCPVEYRSDLSRDDSSTPFFAVTSTEGLHLDPLAGDACDATVLVDTTYPDPAGVSREARAVGSNLALLELLEVQGNYNTIHLVLFQNCSANCLTSFTTSPK
jgi:hypothetical protein